MLPAEIKLLSQAAESNQFTYRDCSNCQVSYPSSVQHHCGLQRKWYRPLAILYSCLRELCDCKGLFDSRWRCKHHTDSPGCSSDMISSRCNWLTLWPKPQTPFVTWWKGCCCFFVLSNGTCLANLVCLSPLSASFLRPNHMLTLTPSFLSWVEGP